MPIFLLIALPLPALSEIEYKGETMQISAKFYDGPYLIYVCAKNHWACVDEDGYKECQKDRKEAEKDYKRNLACTAFKEFKSKKECEIYQQSKVNQPEGKRFCRHPLTK